MKKYLILLFLLSITFLVNARSTVPDSSQIISNSHTFNIYIFNGYALSYNLKECDNSILRLHLDLYNLHDNMDSDQKYTNENESYNSINMSNEETKRNTFSLSVAPIYVYKFYNSHYGYAYFGAGPQFGYYKYYYEKISHDKHEDSYSQLMENKFKTENRENRYTLGAMLLVGIKAEITNHFGVFVESHFNAGRSWRDSKSYSKETFTDGTTSYSSSEGDGAGWTYNFELSRIGISISL